MPRRTTLAYGFLLFLRILIAFTSASLIHPDEHFQNPEIAAGTVFTYGGHGDGPLRTWEWMGQFPCRSVFPVFGSTGLAFAVLRVLVGRSPSARALYLAERAVMLLFSFILDYLVYATSTSRTALLLFASSPVTFTFLLRPFSNSLETLALAFLFNLTARLDVLDLSGSTLLGIGVVLGIGVFIRITFLAFALPVTLALIWQLATGVGSTVQPNFSLPRLIERGLPIARAFLGTILVLGTIDSIHFDLPFHLGRLSPLNLLRYNLSSDNLAEHGLHPRYLHVVANWPMLFGVGLAVVWSALLTQEKRGNGVRSSSRRIVYLASFIIPTLVLSIQPHQESRFLVPLLIPLVFLGPYASFLTSSTSGAKKRRWAFWVLWLLHTVLFTALFGYLHQGGLLPSLFAINDQLRDSASSLGRMSEVEIVFWRTFMPPRHLLIPPTNGAVRPPSIRVIDLAGAALPSLLDTLSSSLSTSSTSSASSTSVLVAPSYSVDALALSCGSSATATFSATAADEEEKVDFRLEPLFDGRSFGVHVDIDRLDGMLSAKGWERTGIGVWEVVQRE